MVEVIHKIIMKTKLTIMGMDMANLTQAENELNFFLILTFFTSFFKK